MEDLPNKPQESDCGRELRDDETPRSRGTEALADGDGSRSTGREDGVAGTWPSDGPDLAGCPVTVANARGDLRSKQGIDRLRKQPHESGRGRKVRVDEF